MSAFEDATASDTESPKQLLRHRAPVSTMKVMLLTLAALIAVSWALNLYDQLTSKAATKAQPTAGPQATSPDTPPTDNSNKFKNPQSASNNLTAILAGCRGECGDLIRPVWQEFSSTTGEMVKVNIKSITPLRGGLVVWTYTYVPGSSFNSTGLNRWLFTCHGQYAETLNINALQDAPPYSVAGAIADVICPIGDAKGQVIVQAARQQRLAADREANDRAQNPRPEDYCNGFSKESCAKIQAGVEAKGHLAICKRGFAIAPTNLTHEQLRICYTRAAADRE